MLPLIALSFISLFAQVALQVVGPGSCPQKNVKTNFDVSKYMGDWYQYASFGTELFQGQGKCVKAEYNLDVKTAKVKVHNTQTNLQTGLGDSIDGFAILENSKDNEGKLLVTFKVLGQSISVTSPYWILDTDYFSWAVVYSCYDVRVLHITSGWILTREQDLSSAHDRKAVLEQINNVLEKAKLDPNMFKRTIQNNCTVD